jgi:hypothetical protein
MVTTLTIARRFNGPPESGNGGYVAGLLAREYEAVFGEVPDYATVQVTLRKPPPMGVDLRTLVPPETELLRLQDGSGTVVADAEVVEAPADASADPVSAAEAAAAAKDYAGLVSHPFPHCFVCGPEHPTGLHVFPGPVPGRRGFVAAPWTPADDTVGPEFVWAALDCPGGWSSGDMAGRPMVLGRMGAQVFAVPGAGTPCVVTGRHLRTEGRKTFTASALYGPDGDLLASAHATWIAVDPEKIRPVG